MEFGADRPRYNLLKLVQKVQFTYIWEHKVRVLLHSGFFEGTFNHNIGGCARHEKIESKLTNTNVVSVFRQMAKYSAKRISRWVFRTWFGTGLVRSEIAYKCSD